MSAPLPRPIPITAGNRLGQVRAMMLLGFAFLSGLNGCHGEGPAGNRPADADPERGRLLIQQYGCGACHRIPGIRDANGLMGPPLHGIARRAYIAGVLPNSFDAMAEWIAHPQRIAPRTAMPHMGLGRHEAQDVAAYLYTLD